MIETGHRNITIAALGQKENIPVPANKFAEGENAETTAAALRKKLDSNMTTAELAKDVNLNAAALDVVCDADIDSDSDVFFKKTKGISDKYTVTAQHSNKTDIQECANFIKQAEQVSVDDFIKAVNTTNQDDKEENYIKAFYDLGRLCHSVQDFYSHTNWINQTGPKVSLWNEKAKEANIDNPKNLKTGHYNEFKQWLEKINPFNKKKNYDKTYVQNSKQSHYRLNKDEPNSVADKAFKAKYGKSGFELACDDATKHTDQEWQEILETLDEKLDDKTYAKLLTDIENFNSTEEESAKILKDCRINFNNGMGD